MERGLTDEVSLREVTSENWREALGLAVRPEQQRFVADQAPIAAVALAKAYVRPGGATWVPYAIYAGAAMVGFVELAYTPGSADDYWIFHFFVDQRYQGHGYGAAALARLIELVRRQHPACEALQLVVHPENPVARRLYTQAAFRPTGAERWGEPVYRLELRAENSRDDRSRQGTPGNKTLGNRPRADAGSAQTRGVHNRGERTRRDGDDDAG